MPARVELGAIRSLAGDRTVMACVKVNAYGHGLVPVARCLEDARVPGVQSADEAAALARGAGGVDGEGHPRVCFLI
jgi:alanine racemase